MAQCTIKYRKIVNHQWPNECSPNDHSTQLHIVVLSNRCKQTSNRRLHILNSVQYHVLWSPNNRFYTGGIIQSFIHCSAPVHYFDHHCHHRRYCLSLYLFISSLIHRPDNAGLYVPRSWGQAQRQQRMPRRRRWSDSWTPTYFSCDFVVLDWDWWVDIEALFL